MSSAPCALLKFWNCAEVTIIDGSPTPPTPNPPTPKPTTPTLPTSSSGYCSWSTPICNGSDSSPWCSETNKRCSSCGGTWCSSSPLSTPAPLTPNPSTSGSKYATTTRYWDCSGGACGCAYLPFGTGTDNKPAMCHSNAMFKAPPSNPHGAAFYGTAAISQGLGGGNWLAEGCGKCWKVKGKSNAPGYEGVKTTLVLKGTNFCPPGNTMCAGSNPHFDISAPGFDVTEFSFSNTCAEREAAESAGFGACGRWLIDSTDPDENCDCSLFKDPVLRAGCDNFFSLKWDNSPVEYEEVNCPTELSRLNCWEENGGQYPKDIPQFCANNEDLVCSDFTKKNKCKKVDACAWGGAYLETCSPRKAEDCSQYPNKNRCVQGGICKYVDGTCVHQCDGASSKKKCKKMKNTKNNKKMCRFVKAKNTCKKCQSKTCGSR